VAETIMALSGTTNGHLATQGFTTLEKRTGQLMHDLAAEHEGKLITFADTQGRWSWSSPPEWSGSSRRAPLQPVHHQRRAAQALAHPDRPAALLPRP
jgi:nitrate reductase alpha subunit